MIGMYSEKRHAIAFDWYTCLVNYSLLYIPRNCGVYNSTSCNVFTLIERHGGSISAEHGLGFDKRQYIYHSQSQKAVSLMGNIKKLFDPKVIEFGEKYV